MRAEGEIMKKISSALLAALLLLATVFTGAPTAMAAGVSVNATTVTVYFLNQEFRKKISQPAAYPASFQLKVTGADKAAYRVTAGESATVSSTGLVEPLCTRYYWYGNVGSTAPTPGKTPDRGQDLSRDGACAELCPGVCGQRDAGLYCQEPVCQSHRLQ